MSRKNQNINKDLKKLKRQDLLQLMVEQSEEIDRLRAELAKAQEELNSRKIAASEAGSLAEAAVKISGVLEAAQEAADLYLENVKQTAGVTDQFRK